MPSFQSHVGQAPPADSLMIYVNLLRSQIKEMV